MLGMVWEWFCPARYKRVIFTCSSGYYLVTIPLTPNNSISCFAKICILFSFQVSGFVSQTFYFIYILTAIISQKKDAMSIGISCYFGKQYLPSYNLYVSARLIFNQSSLYIIYVPTLYRSLLWILIKIKHREQRIVALNYLKFKSVFNGNWSCFMVVYVRTLLLRHPLLCFLYSN